MVHSPYYNSYDVVQSIRNTLKQQHERLNQLENQVQELKQTVSSLEKREPMTFNYKFDQLKIETLEGTLNIGLNPNKDLDDIDEFTVEDQNIQTPPDQVRKTDNEDEAAVLQFVTHQLNEYFRHQAVEDLQQVETEFDYPLDQPYRSFIIDDVKKQIGTRVKYYTEELTDQYGTSQELQNAVVQNVIRDIKQAFHLFLKNLPKQRREDS